MSIVVVPANGGRFDSVVADMEAQGHEVRRLPANFDDSMIDEYFADADAIFGMFAQAPITRAVFERAPRLYLAVSPIIGTETMDVEAATEHGVLVAYGALPDNFEGVAEAIVMLTGALLKRLGDKQGAIREGGWRTANAGKLMRDSTVGLIGFGNIGRATAARFAGFGTTLIAYDPYADAQMAAECGVELVELPTLLGRADVVSIMTVLTEETHHLIGAAEFAAMKPGSYLINTSRGPCVDETALIAALESGHLAGAAIDTFETEPAAADNPLRTMPQVIATGHNVGHAETTYVALAKLGAEQLLDGLAGREPRYVRNPSVIAAWQQRIRELGVVPVEAPEPAR